MAWEILPTGYKDITWNRFTKWENVEGRGGSTGEPHYGNHAWPVMNHAVLNYPEKALLSRGFYTQYKDYFHL